MPHVTKDGRVYLDVNEIEAAIRKYYGQSTHAAMVGAALRYAKTSDPKDQIEYSRLESNMQLLNSVMDTFNEVAEAVGRGEDIGTL